MPVSDTSGLAVTFAGSVLGPIAGFDEDFAAVAPTDKTNATATIVGTGGNTRTVRQVEITMIEPGTLSFRCWGDPPFTRADIGLSGTLAFAVGVRSYSLTAQLANVKRVGSAGELIQGSYVFQFTG